MKKIFTFVLLGTLSQGCDDPSGSGAAITVVQNGATAPSFQAENLATMYFDVSRESIERSELTKSEAVKGAIGGSVQVKGQSIDDAKHFALIFDHLNFREGYPTFQSGEVETNLKYSPTSIQGSIRGKSVRLGEKLLTDFDLQYDLHLWKDFWRGHMKGNIVINGKSYDVDHDYDSPILVSAVLEKNRVGAGEVLPLKIKVNSNSKVQLLQTLIYSENGKGPILLPPLSNEMKFKEISKGVWEYTRTYEIRSSLQPGKYLLKNLSVQNEAELKSLEWKDQLSFEVLAGGNPTTSSLKIESLELIPGFVQNGGTVTAKFTFKSPIAPLGVSAFLTGPSDYLEAVGKYSDGRPEFLKRENDQWVMESQIKISEWLPSGTYQLSNFIAYHEDVFATYDGNPIRVEVQNTKVANKPIILETILEPEAGKRSAMTTFRVRIRSEAPINLLTAEYETPRTSGASMYGYKIMSLGNDEWEVLGGAYIFADSPEGIYSIKNIKARNEGNIVSDPVGPIVFKVEK